MAECPFCKSMIDDELARFGGHCPKCFIEIPGDEAPTDPGLAKRVEQQIELEQQRPWAQVAGFAALAAVVLVAAGAVVAWQVVQQRGAAAIAADLAAEENQEFFYVAPASEHQLPLLGEAGSAVGGDLPVRSEGNARSPAQITDVGSSGGASGAGGRARFDFIGSSDEGEPALADLATRTVDVDPGAVEQSSAGFSSVHIDINRGSIGSMALSDPGEIYKVVGQALKDRAGQMTTCYERRLKAVPTLRGTWEVAFSIDESGATSDVMVRGQALQDPELERCLRETVVRWAFQPMVEKQDIKKNYTFGPAE